MDRLARYYRNIKDGLIINNGFIIRCAMHDCIAHLAAGALEILSLSAHIPLMSSVKIDERQ